jgi:hypothetical protein
MCIDRYKYVIDRLAEGFFGAVSNFSRSDRHQVSGGLIAIRTLKKTNKGDCRMIKRLSPSA